MVEKKEIRKEDIEQYINENGLTYEKFGNLVGYSKNYINMLVNGHRDITKKFKKAFHDLVAEDNEEISIVSEPQMSYRRSPSMANVLHIPAHMEMLYFNDPDNVNLRGEITKYFLPGLPPGDYLSFFVKDNSMFPTLTVGELIVCNRHMITDFAEVQNDYMYAVLSSSNVINIYRAFRVLDTDNTLFFHGDNLGEEEEQAINKDFKGLFRVRRIIKFDASMKM